VSPIEKVKRIIWISCWLPLSTHVHQAAFVHPLIMASTIPQWRSDKTKTYNINNMYSHFHVSPGYTFKAAVLQIIIENHELCKYAKISLHIHIIVDLKQNHNVWHHCSIWPRHFLIRHYKWVKRKGHTL